MEHTAFSNATTIKWRNTSTKVNKCQSFTPSFQPPCRIPVLPPCSTLKPIQMSIDSVSVQAYYLFLDSLQGPTPGPSITEIMSAIAGGTVGVMGTIIALEVRRKNVKERKQCPYCRGSGKLPCGTCCTLGAVPSNNTLTAQEPCNSCAEKGYLVCNHCDGDGRLIPWVYERAIRAQYEDYIYTPMDDYYQDEPPYL